MFLKKYLRLEKEKGIDIDMYKLATIIGVHYETMRNIVNRTRDASLRAAIAIENYTKGQVTCRELLKSDKVRIKIEDDDE